LSGKLAPLALNPDPLTVAAFTVTKVVPVEVNVTDCALELFTPTLPNTRLAALMLSVGMTAALAATVPVPLSPTAVVSPPEQSLAIVNRPVADPGAEGSNCTFRVAV
jgi:hypothetical protein